MTIRPTDLQAKTAPRMPRRRKYKSGSGYGPIAGDGKEEDILYECDTDSFSIREIDRMEKNDYNFTVLAFWTASAT